MKKNIYFIGSEKDLFTVNAASAEASIDDITVNIIDNEKISSNTMKEKVIEKMPSFFIFSLTNLIDENLVGNIIDIEKLNIKIIIILEKPYTVESKIVNSLTGAGALVCYGLLTPMRNFLVSILTGDYIEKNTSNIIEQRELNLNEINDTYGLPDLTLTETYQKQIAIIGGMSKIGTTTVAMQLIKYLQSTGVRVCYVEHNNSGYIKNLKEFINHTQKNNYISYKNIDLYEGNTLFITENDKNYDYIIHDYGDFRNENMDLLSIFEKDSIICVVGCKANEIGAYRLLYDNFSKSNMFTVFNFTPEEERVEILTKQGYMKEKTLFLNYCPDMFMLPAANTEIFNPILKNISSRKIIKESRRRKLLKGDY